jgi:hypothetical protein
MEYDHHMVQDFDQDLGLAQPDFQRNPKQVPTFYQDVYTTNEQLNFQNRQRSPQKIEFTGAQPIEIKRTAARVIPNQVPRKAKAKSKGRKKAWSSKPITKKPHVSKPTVTKKTIEAYLGKPATTEEKENKEWNFDTKTTPYFDKGIRKQLISHPIRDVNRLTEAEDAATESWIIRPNVDREERRKKSKSPTKYGLENKKNYFTDLDDFTQHIVDGGEEVNKMSRARGEMPKSSRRPNSQYNNESSNRQRASSTSNVKKEVNLEEYVEKMMQKQEDKEGKPNPFFARRAREILKKHRDNPNFFVSMSVPREQIYQQMPKAKKNTTISTNPKYLDYEHEPVHRSPVREAPALREIDKRERVVEQERIYRGRAGDYGEQEEDLDVYPTRDNGDQNYENNNQNNVRAFTSQQTMNGSGKKLGAAGARFAQVAQVAQVAQNIHKKYINEDLKRHHKQEIERRVELDNAMGEYRTKLEERAADPNRHFEKISQGLQNIRKEFSAVSQDMELTNTYMKKTMGTQKGSETILARGAGKIIKLYSDQLTELMLDDLIYELIPILHEKEQGEKRRTRKQTKKDILNDCLEALKDFTFEQKKVVDKAEEIYTMTTMTRNRMKELDSGYPGSRVLAKVLKKRVELTGPLINVVKEHVNEQKEWRKTTDIFSGKTNIMMDFIVKSMMDDLTKDVVNQFVLAQNEYVDRVLINEFEF